MRLLVTKSISGTPLRKYPELIGINKITGFPTAIQFLEQYRETTRGISFILTLLTVSRAMDLVQDPDYSSIINPFKGFKKSIVDPLFIKRFVKDFELTLEEPIFDTTHFYFTGRAGPHGSNALITAFQGLLTMTGSMLNQLNCVSPQLVKYIATNFFNIKAGINPDLKYGMINRRLSIVNDPEAKARVIAIFDYWSQLALNPMSKDMFNLLRTKFSQDRTFTQNPKIKALPGNKFWSLDLTAATDRFPVEQQELLLQEMYNSSRISYGWRSLLTAEPFLTPDGQILKYAVGQPMGARTS